MPLTRLQKGASIQNIAAYVDSFSLLQQDKENGVFRGSVKYFGYI